MTVNLTALAQEIHGTALEKGFWDKERNMGEMLMLVVSELAEALEAHRDGKDPVYYEVEGGKPEGAAIELADAVIRCLDTLHYKWDLTSPIEEAADEFREAADAEASEYYKLSDNFGENLLKITDIACRAQFHYMWLLTVVVMCERLCQTMGWDVWGLARIKMDYNSTRPYMHGKAY